MNHQPITFHGAELHARGSGALYWPEHRTLIVSDLHIGKCARLSAIGGAALPPYDAQETLMRLEGEIEATGASTVICLGDSFDTAEIGAILPENERLWIARLQAGRDWVWIEGNHDPGPVELGGRHAAELSVGDLVFRHIATPHGAGEVSGHYHPKARINARGRQISRPCFLIDEAKLILPAFGAYTGGLRTDSATLSRLLTPSAKAILTGAKPATIPMPR